MKKIVIFDMDGTLIDSKKDITISVNYVREKNHSLPPLSEEFIVNAINKKERNLAYLFYQTQTYEHKLRNSGREFFDTNNSYRQKPCRTRDLLFVEFIGTYAGSG